jgi:hypothetical protein
VRDLGAQAPVRRVSAATLSPGHRSIAATAMLEILQQAAREFLAGRRSCVRAA